MKKIKKNSWLFGIFLFLSLLLMGVVEYQNYLHSNVKKENMQIQSTSTSFIKEEEKLKELIASGKLSNKIGMYWHKVTE